MTATYQLTIDELKPDFIDRLKQLFPAGQVTIVVEEHDETKYLLSNPANRSRLMQAIEHVKEGKIIEVDFDAIVRQLAD